MRTEAPPCAALARPGRCCGAEEPAGSPGGPDRAVLGPLAAVRAGTCGWAAPVRGSRSAEVAFLPFCGIGLCDVLFVCLLVCFFFSRQETLFVRLKRPDKALVVSRHRVC